MEDEQADYIKEERKRFREHINELKEEIEKSEANETQLLKIINEIKEDKANQWIELEGAKEIIKSHQPIEKEANEEINKLKARIDELQSFKDNQVYLRRACDENFNNYMNMINKFEALEKINEELKLKSQSDYQTYKNMGQHIDKLNEEIKELKQEKKHNKSENTRLKNKLEETERFRQENSKAVKETVEETYKLNAVINKLKKDNDFTLENKDHFNNDETCCLGCVCSNKIDYFTKVMNDFDKKRNEENKL